MDKNSVIYEDYPQKREVGIPAEWVFVAEDYLDEDEFKEWLYITFCYMGFCGMKFTGNSKIDMLLNAIYDEDDTFFKEYYKSLLLKRMPLQNRLKVSKMWSKEDQLDAYQEKQNKESSHEDY